MLKRHRTAPVRQLALAAASAATVLAVFTLSGCESGSGSGSGDTGRKDKSAAQPGPSVIAPGRPGEAAETLSAEDAAEAVADDSPNAADFAYTQMMITHHQQALTMAGLVPDRAASAKVKRLAERIEAAQRPEIESMKSWLENNGGEKAHGEHEHGTMPGMATGKQLDELRAADGEKFDALFLELMIAHHEGAVSMAEDVLADGKNLLVQEMANDVIAQQSAEIGRMREMS
ncbi:DUF305 domain-containing protein [Streptomyces sp. GC420]|uniref:DUF305 domain-containing protein n=1 Tax=Streptomyces sp. GC420 TaxID=2697568 RepID=UPI001414FBEA|nr:DUF305 domain-containing protein [Streptomyces sp. GC420]NBM14625.1 DUF305 domain-containing protein [Streptomyces sp. GC420]